MTVEFCAGTITADKLTISDKPAGIFEIVTVDGRPRFAIREGLTTSDLAEWFDRRVVKAVRKAQRDRRL